MLGLVFVFGNVELFILVIKISIEICVCLSVCVVGVGQSGTTSMCLLLSWLMITEEVIMSQPFKFQTQKNCSRQGLGGDERFVLEHTSYFIL